MDGKVLSVWERVVESVKGEEMSHSRTAVRTPDAWRVLMKAEASGEEAPERDMKMRCLAPWVVSQLAMLRPRPPRPPARR